MSKLDGVPEALEAPPKPPGPMTVVIACMELLGWDPAPEVTAKVPLWKVKINYASRLKRMAAKERISYDELLATARWARENGRTIQNPVGLVYLHKEYDKRSQVRRVRPEDNADLQLKVRQAISAEQLKADRGEPAPFLDVLMRVRGPEAMAEVLQMWKAEQ